MAFERLEYLVSVDPTGATAGLNRIGATVKKNVAEADAELATLQKRIDSLNAKSVRLGRKGDVLGSDVAAIQAKEAGGELAALQAGGAGGLSGVATGAAAAGVALAGVGAGLAFVKKSVGDFQQLTGEVRQFQRVTGQSAENASALAFTFKRLGIDADTGSKALFIFGKNVQGHEEKLKSLGVEVTRDSKGNVDFAKTLENVSTAYQGTTDATKRSAIAGAAFGRGGEALLPVLAKTKAELADIRAIAEKQGLIFDQKAVDQGRDLTLAMRDIDTAIKGIEVDTAKTFVPLIKDLADTAGAVLPLVHSLHLVDSAANAGLGGLPNIIAGAKDAYHRLTGTTDDHAKAAKDDAEALGADTAALAEAETAAEKAAKADEKAAAAKAASSQKTLSADSAALSAAEALQSADERVAAAKEALAKTDDDVAKNAEKVAAARQTEADAVRGVADAEKALADVQREAPRNLERANIAQRSAERARDAAQKEYDKVLSRRGTGDTTGKLAEAHDRLASSVLDVADAHDKVNDLQSGKPVQDAIRARDAALRTQADAEKRTRDALAVNPLEPQQKAMADLTKAEAGRQRAADVLKNKLGAVSGELTAGLDTTKATKHQVGLLVDGLQHEVDKQTVVNQGLDDQLTKLREIAALAGAPRPAPPSVAAGIRSDLGSVPGSRTTVNGQFNGPITVVANDPNEVANKIAAQVRIQRLGIN